MIMTCWLVFRNECFSIREAALLKNTASYDHMPTRDHVLHPKVAKFHYPLVLAMIIALSREYPNPVVLKG